LHGHFVLGIASGAFRDEIDALLAHARVQRLFTTVVAAEDVRTGKPSPEPFRQALANLNQGGVRRLQPAHCVVIEDSPYGITAAHAAGMQCVAVTTSHDRAALAAADAIISHVNVLRREDLQP
jgi:beta-phosphoglucomutase-like phosphatase (HAD superfamily)